jgi:hypothetical protein
MVTNSYYTPGTPLVDVITLETAKKQLRIDPSFTEENDLISSYIVAALAVCENFIGRSINPRLYTVELDGFDSTFEFSQNYDNDTVPSVEYYAPGSDTAVNLEENKYKLRNSTTIECKQIKFTDIPATDKRDDAVIITIQQGFDTIPTPITQAMLLIISDMYERRDDREVGLNSASNALLRPYRKY